MADKRLTSHQRKSQAAEVSRKIEAEAGRIATEFKCSIAEATQRIFQDSQLLQACHDVGAIDEYPSEPS